MLILNNKKFAANDKEFINSLFETGGTCVGYHKMVRGQMILMDHQRNRIGVINRHGVLCCATKMDDGKYWYSYATIKQIGDYESYGREVRECRTAVGLIA